MDNGAASRAAGDLGGGNAQTAPRSISPGVDGDARGGEPPADPVRRRAEFRARIAAVGTRAQMRAGEAERLLGGIDLTATTRDAALIDARVRAIDANLAKPGETTDADLIGMDLVVMSLEEDDAARQRDFLGRAERQALLSYCLGMVAGFGMLLAVIGLIVGTRYFRQVAPSDWDYWLSVLVAGAVGAVISVLSRLPSGRLGLQHDAGKLLFLIFGGIRPVIGAVFGLVIYVLLVSQLVSFELRGDATIRLHAILILAFFAGFSERWAQDMLVNSAGRAIPSPADAPSR
jgi:hypothetical protein